VETASRHEDAQRKEKYFNKIISTQVSGEQTSPNASFWTTYQLLWAAEMTLKQEPAVAVSQSTCKHFITNETLMTETRRSSH
jgi:hypothetical protein